MAKPAPPPPPDFESAMSRLDEIVTRMESNRLPLNELLAGYEEGTKLVDVCTAQLNAAEKRIEMIARTVQGEPEVVPFTARAVPSESSPERSAPAARPSKARPEADPDEVSLF